MFAAAGFIDRYTRAVQISTSLANPNVDLWGHISVLVEYSEEVRHRRRPPRRPASRQSSARRPSRSPRAPARSARAGRAAGPPAARLLWARDRRRDHDYHHGHRAPRHAAQPRARAHRRRAPGARGPPAGGRGAHWPAARSRHPSGCAGEHLGRHQLPTSRMRREFDLVAKAFVDGGFSLPAAKSRVAWLDLRSGSG